jgi:hypothetical protein
VKRNVQGALYIPQLANWTIDSLPLTGERNQGVKVHKKQFIPIGQDFAPAHPHSPALTPTIGRKATLYRVLE